MVARTGARPTALACLGLVALLIVTDTACSPEPLPVPADLSGDWILSDSVSGLVQNEEVPPRVCKTWGRPLQVFLLIGDSIYGAEEPYGGTVSCVVDGVFAEPSSLQGQRSFFLENFADSVTMRPRPGAYQEVSISYRATTISSDRLAGEVYLPILGRPDDHAVHGTWEMVRTR